MLADLPGNVVGFEAVGEVTSEDYRNVLIPAAEAALEKNDKVRLLYVLGERFDAISAGAVFERQVEAHLERVFYRIWPSRRPSERRPRPGAAASLR
jgi:SpoIIAA-like